MILKHFQLGSSTMAKQNKNAKNIHKIFKGFSSNINCIFYKFRFAFLEIFFNQNSMISKNYILFI